MLSIFKRISFFLIVNILVMITITISWSLISRFFGIEDTYFNYLIFFSLALGIGGAFISLALSKFMAKKLMGVKIISPQSSDPHLASLTEKVRRFASQAGLKQFPEVGVYESPEVNAFATGPSKKNSLVAVSTGLLQKLNEDEVEGVLAHEVAHIANGDMVTMTLIQGIINAFVIFLSRILANLISRQMNNDRGRFFIELSLVIAFEILFSVLGSLVVNAFSRAREFRADRGGARLAGKDKMISALSALLHRISPHSKQEHKALATLKISGPKKGGWQFLFSTHPPLEERIERLKRV